MGGTNSRGSMPRKFLGSRKVGWLLPRWSTVVVVVGGVTLVSLPGRGMEGMGGGCNCEHKRGQTFQDMRKHWKRTKITSVSVGCWVKKVWPRGGGQPKPEATQQPPGQPNPPLPYKTKIAPSPFQNCLHTTCGENTILPFPPQRFAPTGKNPPIYALFTPEQRSNVRQLLDFFLQ